MLRDVEPFENVWRRLRGASRGSEAIISFVRFIERRFGADVVYDTTRFAQSRSDLADILEIAEKLRAAGVVSSFGRTESMSDEPKLSHWWAKYRETEHENTSGGCTTDDDRLALTSALAEGLERHIWFERSDYFSSPLTASPDSMSRPYVDPNRFAGFSDAQRATNSALHLTPQSTYLWIRGTSLLDDSSVWLPAQTVSASPTVQTARRNTNEPLIRRAVTTGLATHPERTQALLLGALEVIERDAYIITWLNQLSPPRIEAALLAQHRASFAKLLAICARYRLKPHILLLPTDAPAFAVVAVVEDETENAPRLAVGLKAHRDLPTAAEKAVIEALRARRGGRSSANLKKVEGKKPKDIGHYDRLAYWASGSKFEKLLFLIKGPHIVPSSQPWEADSVEAHLRRIVDWCREKKYACATVPFTSSRVNVTPWHVEMVVIPELQPLYYAESLPHLGGKRLTDIPTRFGYTPRSMLYTDEPHPFA